MTATDKVIITCAITGAIHTPNMSPYLPITPDQIVAEAIAAAEAGAAILHLHARDPETGKPDQSPEAFARFLPRVKQGTNAAINITTGGSPYMRVEERVQPAAIYKPEVASLNMGSMNFGLYHLLAKYKEFKFEWEKQHLEATRDLVFRNSYKDIEFILATCYGNDTRFEFECYDIAHLYNLAHFADRNLVKPPFFVQSVFGLLGGIGTHPEDVAHMKRTADRLFGDSYRWSVLGAGASQLRIAAQAAAMGSNIRVGLEDSLWAGKGKLAKSNAEQVKLARKIIEGLGKEVTRPAKSSASRAATKSPSRERAMLRIEVACADRDQLGEGPLWDVDEQRLYWIDSYGPAMHRMEPSGAKKTWPLPEPIGSMVLRRGGGAILSLRSGFFAFDFTTGEAKRICETNRANCGRASMTATPIGRAGSSPGQWISRSATLSASCSASTPTSQFIRLMKESSAPMGRAGVQTDERFTLPTPAAGRSTRTTTTRRPGTCVRELRAAARLSGRRNGRRRRLRLERRGLFRPVNPLRYPMGVGDRIVGLPVQSTTSLTFGGAGLDIAYVTSMGRPIGGQYHREREAGCLFKIHGLGVRGLPEPRFAG
jgi:uncharacterized protein (DUF849 family)